MSTDQNPTEHPEGLIEGLRQSAAGETEHLGSFEQYADTVIEDGEEDAPVRKVGDVFIPTAEEKASWSNLDSYEQATAIWASGEICLVPLRPGIVATYTENDLGYLIQETESGFRYIGVEAGEPDDFGAFYSRKRAAIQAAVLNWREFGQGDGWAEWSRQMAKDATVVAGNAETIARYLSQAVAAEALTPDEIETISQGLAEHLAG